MKKVLVLLLFAWWAITPASSQSIGIDTAVALSLRDNPSILGAEQTLLKTKSALDGTFLLDRSRISLTGDLKISELQAGQTFWDLISGAVQLSVPVVPQLSLQAAMDAKNLSVSVLWSPFSPSKITPKDQESYLKAVLTLQSLQLETAVKAEYTLLAFMAAHQQVSYAQQQYAWALEQNRMTELLYEAGVVTYNDLEEALQEASKRRQAVYTAQRLLLEKTRESNSLLGPQFSMSDLQFLTLDELLDRVTERRRNAQQLQDQIAYSFSIEKLLVEINSLEAQLKQLMIWRPDISFGVKAGVPTSSSATMSMQASVSFSPSDIQFDTKRDLEMALSQKTAELKLEQFFLSLEKDMRQKSMDIAYQALEASLYDRDQALIRVQEAALLYSYGDRTEQEVRQVELSAQNAELQSYLQASACLKSINEYLMLFKQ